MIDSHLDGKLTWEKPTLEVLGDLEALTAAGGAPTPDAGTSSPVS